MVWPWYTEKPSSLSLYSTCISSRSKWTWHVGGDSIFVFSWSGDSVKLSLGVLGYSTYSISIEKLDNERGSTKNPLFVCGDLDASSPPSGVINSSNAGRPFWAGVVLLSWAMGAGSFVFGCGGLKRKWSIVFSTLLANFYVTVWIGPFVPLIGSWSWVN